MWKIKKHLIFSTFLLVGRSVGRVEGENIFSYKYMFLKINHLFVYFLAWNFFHGKNFLRPKSERNEKNAKEKEATSDRREGERVEWATCIGNPGTWCFCSWWLPFLRISGVHTRNITFRKLCLPIDMAGASSSSPLTAGASVRVCVQIFHTHAPSVQLEIYQALPSSISFVFSQLPFSLRLSYSSILRFFRLLIYYVPKKNCYRWSIFKFFLD